MGETDQSLLEEDAHRAARVVECQEGSLPCLNPANNIVYAFLLEVRKRYLQKEQPTQGTISGDRDPGARPSNFQKNLKVAMNSLKDHPLKVFDLESALLVKGVGPKVAQVIQEGLFSQYPAQVPKGDELSQYNRGRNALKQAEGLKRKRLGDYEMGGRRLSGSKASLDKLAEPGVGMSLTEIANASLKKRESSKKKERSVSSRGTKEYIPGLGTANYAFLIVLFQAQKGPEGLEYLSKSELMDRAESSGLSNKPIHSEGARSAQNPRAFFNGWSSFKIAMNHNLAYTWGRPMKISLTSKGVALAERLYRDAVSRGKTQEIPDLDPLILQKCHQGESETIGRMNGRIREPKDDHAGQQRVHDLHANVAKGTQQSEPSIEYDGVNHSSSYPRCDSSLLERWRDSKNGCQRLSTFEMRPLLHGSQDATHDSNLAHLLEMGYSERRARQALQASSNLEGAMDIIDVISESDASEEEIPSCQPARKDDFELAMSKSASGIGHLNSSSQATSGSRLNYSGMPSISSQSTKQLPDIPILRAKSGQDTSKIALSYENIPKELDNIEYNILETRMPPVMRFSSFESRYDVVLLVDEREQYSRSQSGSLSRALSAEKYIERMRQSGCKVERRCLPVGDALWVARNKQIPGCEYVLDYVLERKSLDDLIHSIRSSDRYKNQKYRLKRCGLQNIFYLVEGEVESLPSALEHKTVCTACAKTNAIDGFRVIRTKNVTETLRLYKDMTLSIIELYSKTYSKAANASPPVTATWCQTFQEFSNRCTDIDKGMTTLQDIWVMMLCEIPGLGPEVACAIARHYPTPRALWDAYSSKSNVKTCSAKENPDTMLASISLGSGYRKVGVECSRKVFSSLFFK